MKLKHINTQIYCKDEKQNSYLVVFEGTHKNIKATLHKNGVEVAKYELGYGHANKTAAINIIKKYCDV